jgi:hypothetical protein
MMRKGIAYTLRLIEPGLWKWQFQIGATITIGTTRTSLMGMAAHSASSRIDRELKKARGFTPR